MYVLNGKVVLYPDGTGVDKQESDDVLYVQDVQAGELFTIAPNRISELAEPTDPQAVIAEREEEIAAAMNQEIAQEEGAEGGTAVASVSREGKYTNFALTLAAMYKVQTQTAIQQTFNEMFDLLQGRQQPDLLNPNPNNTPRTLAEAIREVLNIEYDGTNGSHALGGNNETRTTGRQGSARDDSAGGTDAQGNAAADAEGGTERDKGRVGTENEGRGNKEKENDETEVIGSSMTADEALDFIADMELGAEIAPEIDLTIENWDALFGKEGIVSTPIGNVKMGENQFTKLMRQGRNGKLGMIKPTLEHPHAIIADVSEAKEGDTTERASSYVFIRSFKKVDGSRYYYFTSITVSKDGKEVVISNQEKRRNAIANLLTKGKLVWKHADDVSDASDMAQGLYSSQGNVSDLATEGTDAPQTTISSTGKDTPENSAVQTSGQENAETSLQSEVTRAEQQTNAEPTEGQKEAGNYKKGRVKVGPFDVVIEQPRGSVRSGVDANGKAWETTMQNTYGYFGGTKGVDGDAIDVFLGNDLDGWDGITVFVVDQYNPDGSFDEHKVMLGFNSQEEAEAAYFANYEADWAKTHRTEVTAVSLADFTEWVKSSKRKTKAFAEYKVAKRNAEIDAHNAQNEQLAEQLFSMAKEAETEKDFFDRAASLFEVTGYQSDLRDIYNGVKSGEIANARALSFYTNATLKPVKVKAPKSEQKQKAEAPRQSGYERKHWHADSSLEEMLAREKYLQNAMSFGTKEMAEVFPMAEEWQRDREELKAKYGDDLKDALPNDVKNAFLKKHRNTFANQTALNDELYELRSAIISHKEKAASRAEAAAKEQKAEEANKRFGDFLNGKTPLRRASIVKALTRVSNFGKEGSMTMAQFIEKHVAEGTLELRTKEVDKLQGPSRRQLNRMDASQQTQAENRVKQAGKKTEYLINGFVANKTAYEYAEHLLATKKGKAGEKARKHAAKPGTSAVSTQEATLRDALVDVAQQSGLEVVVDEKAQQVLDEVNGRARTMAFGEEYDYDRYPEGRVEPNIADKYVHIERAKLDHGFANFNEAKEWAKSHIVRTLNNEESGGKGNVKISSTAVNKYLSESAVAKSDSKDVHLAVLKKLPEIIHDSVDVETTPDFKKDENGVRKVGNEINKNVLIHRCYGAVEINGNIYRVKITLKEYKDAVRDNKAYSYEATKIELLAGTLVGRNISSNPGTNNSISVAKLLKDVEMSYRPGVKVLEESAKQRARLREHRYFRTPGGEAYGFTVDGKIYLDPRIATAETPIHEYAHLWADMIRNVNAEAWNDIVGLMKATPIWEEVRGLYPELKTDDEIADEVLAHYSGRRGAERLREAQQHAAAETGKSVFERAAAVAAIERVKQALAKFWQSVAELFHIRFTSAEEVADRVLADMLNGVNPNKVRNSSSVNVAEFAAKHHLNQNDVKKYADSMKSGSLGGASYAFKNIKRSVLLANEGLSLGQFVKVFKPIKNELFSNFGNVEELREEHVQEALNNRNVMEAARKREEAEKEAERKRLEVFEQMSDEALDKAYMEAVRNNDEQRMRDLVNEAARRKGYQSTDEFRMSHRAPSYDEDGTDKSLIDVANNKDNIRDSLEEQFRMNRDQNREESVAAISQAIQEIEQGKNPTVTIYRAVPKSLKEGSVRNGDWVTLSEAYAKQHGRHALNGDYRIMKENVPAANLYWDGNDINEWGYDDKRDYKYKDTRNNRKLNDLIVRDDKGAIIPLSKRFNTRKKDVRFQFVGQQGAAALDKAEEATTRLDNLGVAREMERSSSMVSPLEMSDAEKYERGERLRNAPAVDVESNQIVKTEHLSARKAAEKWWDEHVGQPLFFDTEVGSVCIDKSSIKDSLSHGYRQEKLDAIASLPNGFKNATYIGSLNDFKRSGVTNHYFVYPINYNGQRRYVFCRTMSDNNKNRLYVHEVFMENTINESDTLQTIASASLDGELHGGVALYKAILKNILDAAKVAENPETSQLSEENNFREGKGELSNDMLSYLNDPMAQMMGKPRGTKKQRAQFAERERGRMQAHAQNLVERLHLPNVEIVTDASQLEGKQRTAKGFYNKRTGKITIVLPNHASTADVEQTLLHEAVAHYGLRQLFGEHFDDFLDMVYRNAEEGIRRKIAEASAKHGWNVRTATEEYLADLAERTDFEHASPQWWAKIKGFFLDMLRGLGFEAMDGQTLTDNELRYVLWRSYENLTEPGKYPTFIAEARDVAKQHALQVGRFAPTETTGSRVAENEALSEEEMSEILFRDGSTYNYTQVLARDRYERRIKSGMYQTQEALQDSMLGLRTAMESILEAEGRKGVYIEDIDGFENAYLGENRLSSVNQAEAEKFAREQFKVSSKKVCGCNIWVRQNVVASYVLAIGKR